MEIKKKDTQWVQDTCNAIRPLIGAEKASALWQMYLFSDEKGREELEEELQLLANSLLHRDVQNETPVFRPPGKDTAAGEFVVGNVVYNGKELYPFGLTARQIAEHTAIAGRSGSGKTTLAFQLAKSLWKQGVPWLVLDWKRSWRDLMQLPGFSGMRVYTIGKDTSPVKINALAPPAGMDPKVWIKALVECIAKAYFCGEGVMFLLTTIFDQLFTEYGVYSGTVTRYPTFHDVLKRLKSFSLRGREMLWQASAMRAVHSLTFGPMDSILNISENAGIEDFLQQPTVLELESLAHSDKLFFSELLLLKLYAHRLNENKRNQLSHCLFIEEAHHLLSNLRRRGGEPASIVEVVFREIRELSEGILFLDQVPSEISRTALANTATSITLNLKGRPDVSTMASAMLLDKDQETMLGKLPVGQAIVKLQGKIPAFMVQIPDFKMARGAINDEMIRERMKPFIVPAEQRHEPETRLTETESAFLKDIALVPDCGVVARYTRLKLSGRQGDKVKRSLIEMGYVEEIEKATPTGRKKVLRLTEKGNGLLRDAGIETER